MELDLNKIQALYGECVVYGPTQYKDLRYRCSLAGINSNKGFTRFISYPKLLMECHLMRRLGEDETVDHIDANHSNNAIGNLQILTRVENAKKGHADGNCSADHLIAYANSVEGKAASSSRMKKNNPQSKLTESDVAVIRNSFKNKTKTLQQLALEYNVGERTIYNCLTGCTHDYYPGAISKSEFKRLNKESKHALSK